MVFAVQTSSNYLGFVLTRKSTRFKIGCDSLLQIVFRLHYEIKRNFLNKYSAMLDSITESAFVPADATNTTVTNPLLASSSSSSSSSSAPTAQDQVQSATTTAVAAPSSSSAIDKGKSVLTAPLADMKITISEPQKHGEGSGAFVSYLISTSVTDGRRDLPSN